MGQYGDWTRDKNAHNTKTVLSASFMTIHSYLGFLHTNLYQFYYEPRIDYISLVIGYDRLNKVKIITKPQTTAADISITCDLAFLTFAK